MSALGVQCELSCHVWYQYKMVGERKAEHFNTNFVFANW